jgi:hypothetical protein
MENNIYPNLSQASNGQFMPRKRTRIRKGEYKRRAEQQRQQTFPVQNQNPAMPQQQQSQYVPMVPHPSISGAFVIAQPQDPLPLAAQHMPKPPQNPYQKLVSSLSNGRLSQKSSNLHQKAASFNQQNNQPSTSRQSRRKRSRNDSTQRSRSSRSNSSFKSLKFPDGDNSHQRQGQSKVSSFFLNTLQLSQLQLVALAFQNSPRKKEDRR